MASSGDNNDSIASYPQQSCYERMALKMAPILGNQAYQTLESIQILQSLIGLIIGCGILANAVNILVFVQSIMRQCSINCFLLGLSVIDLILLVIQIPQSLDETTGVFKQYHEYGFRQYTIARYAMSFILMSCSVWLLIAMVGDRIVSVWKSTKNDNKHVLLVSNKVTYISISVICSVCFLIHVTKFAEYKPNPNLYSPKLVQKTSLGSNPVYEVYTYLANIVLSVMLPMFVLLFAVGFFLYRHIKYGTVFNKNRVVLNTYSSKNILMLCLSTFYVICHAIAMFFMFKTILPFPKNAGDFQSLAILRAVNELMVLSYIALKFFIYLFFVQNFKGTLKDILLCKRMAEYRLPPDGNGQDVMTKTMPPDDNEIEGMCETQCSFENPVYGTKVNG